MTIVGQAFIEIVPTDKGFEAKVVATANAAAKKAAGALVIPAKADPAELDKSVVTAAKAAAKKATKELSEIPGGVDAPEFERRVAAAANDAAAKAAAKLANIPAGVDVSRLEAEVANAAARAAAGASGSLDAIKLEVDGQSLVRDVDHTMDQAERRVDAGAKRMRDDTGSALGGLGGLVAKSFAAIGVGQLLFGSVEAIRSARSEARETAAVIRSTGGAANVTAKDVDRLTASLRAKKVVDDDEVRAGVNMLLTFTNVRNEVGRGNDVFNQATDVLVDMAAKFGGIESASIQLGKALNDPVKGVSALAEVGVSFTAQQRDQIAAMVAAGDTAKAQRVILGELSKEFGGTAAAQADDLDRLALKYDDFKERVGASILGVVGALSEIPGPVQALGVGLVGLAVGAVAINKVVTAVVSLREAMAASSFATGGLRSALGTVGGVAAGLGAAAVGINLVDAAILRLQHGGAPKLTEMANDLVRFGKEGKAAGSLSKEFGNDFSKLGDKLKDLEGGVGSGGILGNIFGPGARGRVSDAKRDVDALDKSLAQLVATGHEDVAAGLLSKVAAEAGVSVAQVKKHLDDYRGALAATDTEQRLAAGSGTKLADATDDTADSIGDAAKEADKAAKALDGFKQALDKAIGVQVNAQRAAISYIDAVQALRDSVAEHGKTLDLNSDAGRRNREAILAVVDGARQHIEAMADEGASAGELNRTWATHRDELAKVLAQLGLNKGEAAGYLGLLDKVPTTVFTDLAVRDKEARNVVRSFVDYLDKQLDVERIINVTLNPVTGKLELHTSPLVAREHGGPVYRGQGYVVGEKRPEWFVPDVNGWVYPTVPKAASGAIVNPSAGGTLVQVAEAGRAEAIVPLPPGLVSALERLAAGGATGQFRDLVVQGATVDGAWATGMEVVRQMRADAVRHTGGRVYG